MNQVLIQYFKTPYGELTLGSFEQQLCLCDWTYRRMRTTIDKRIQSGLNATYNEQHCDFLTEASHQLSRYFENKLQQFDIPLLMAGTPFQETVWSALQEIPYAATTSYSALADSLNNSKAVRAVASAIGANAISIIIPCHRVIGSKGELTGYAGGLAAKQKLLALERN